MVDAEEVRDSLDSLTVYTDWVLDTQVGSGRFHIVYMLLLSLAYGMPSVHTYAEVFAAIAPGELDPPFGWHQDGGHCEAGANCTCWDENCCHVPLENWEPDESGRTIVTDFKLICSNEFKVPLLGSIYFTGFALGLIVFGQVSDRLGRKPGHLFSLGFTAAGGFLAPAAPSWYWYAAAKLLQGFGVAGAGVTTFVWLAEYLPPGLRPAMAAVPNVFFSIAQALPSLLAATINGWRNFLLVGNVCAISAIIYAPCLDESPRWLALQGQGEKVHRIACTMARCNGVPLPPPPSQMQAQGSVETQAGSDVAAGMNMARQLCSPVFLPRFLVMGVSWYSISFAFYGLGFFAPNLPLNAYVANVVSASVSLPFYMLGQLLVDAEWCGRKGATVGGFLIGGAGLLASTLIKDTVVSMVLYYAANGALSLAFGVIYMWSSELFPTDTRSRCMSYQSVFARAGAIVAPFVVAIGRTRRNLALMLFAGPCLASGLLDLWMPETRGARLPNTLADIVDSRSVRAADIQKSRSRRQVCGSAA